MTIKLEAVHVTRISRSRWLTGFVGPCSGSSTPFASSRAYGLFLPHQHRITQSSRRASLSLSFHSPEYAFYVFFTLCSDSGTKKRWTALPSGMFKRVRDMLFLDFFFCQAHQSCRGRR